VEYSDVLTVIVRYRLLNTNIGFADIDITICHTSPGTTVMTWGAMRYRHPITIIVADRRSETFDYHGSEAGYIAHKDMLSELDIIDALECILNDAIAGTYNCAEFFNEFGYEDPCKGLKAWKECVRTSERLVNMGIAENMFYDMLNELNEGN